MRYPSSCSTRRMSLGYAEAIAMAKGYPAIVESGLAIKRAGNTMARVVGGSEVYPIDQRPYWWVPLLAAA